MLFKLQGREEHVSKAKEGKALLKAGQEIHFNKRIDYDRPIDLRPIQYETRPLTVYR